MTWWWRRGVRVYEQAHWEPRRPLGVSRRAFLRGASVSLALPLLPSALPRSSWAAGGEAPSRLVFYYVPNGMQMQWWTPSAEGVGYDLPSILEPLASIQDKVSVLTGLSNLSAAVPVAVPAVPAAAEHREAPREAVAHARDGRGAGVGPAGRAEGVVPH